MRILIAEDDIVSQSILEAFLTPYGVCDVAINGRKAFEAFKAAWDEGKQYDLLCLDIMMPEMSGQEVLCKVREYERNEGIGGLDGVKIIMTTALGDAENIRKAFREQCEAYLVKPVEKVKLINALQELGLI
ncbi:response regulator [Pseudobacteroides cellulosolvens]|uniref:Stage 0 sporulation protein A homolog n=1 Tax=Pseudobacteroides cellulosolvens ATCC 35603 = DSM 2933 TaxID=398512 RepID=A0A0L6JK99_9FIRM|nr:response regulator [Pseudobacteroides cellulosolvens]KNY26281.1 response regulator receiver protein [Pseudobacteroides cellulosolvens ATCC 35603 = DSM 2933]